MDLRHSNYDGDLQMFVDSPREPDMARLTFLRWLIEQRLLEHGPAGAPSGDLAGRLALSDDEAVELKAA
jgi:hypothetical protein